MSKTFSCSLFLSMGFGMQQEFKLIFKNAKFVIKIDNEHYQLNCVFYLRITSDFSLIIIGSLNI